MVNFNIFIIFFVILAQVFNLVLIQIIYDKKNNEKHKNATNILR